MYLVKTIIMNVQKGIIENTDNIILPRQTETFLLNTKKIKDSIKDFVVKIGL